MSSILEEYCHEVEIIGKTNSIVTAKELIIHREPDLVFLDTNSRPHGGLQLLDSLEEISFLLIVTSDHEEDALKAFEYDAIDYLIKPYNPEKIIRGIKKVFRIKELMSTIKFEAKISLSTDKGVNIIDYNDIIYASSDRPYSKLHMINGKCVLVSKTIKQLEAALPKRLFYRLHASYLINLNNLRKYRKEDGGYVVMNCGTQIPLARRRKIHFLNLISKNKSILSPK